ncbi:MAG: MASE3 domain-containing protein, partial [Thermodesulfovibrionales bacterium]
MKTLLLNELSSIKTIAFLVFIYALYYLDFLVFHIVIETYTVFIAFALALFIWNTRQYHSNNFFLILGLAFVYIGIVDFIHTFAYEGMGFKNLSNSNRASQLWIFNRYVQSVSFILAILLIKKRVNFYLLTAGYTVIYILGLLSILVFDIFPDCYIENEGQTTFKVTSEYIVISIFIGVLYLLKRSSHQFDEYTLKLIKLSIIFAICQEMMFALYISVFSIVNATGHVFKLFSFYFLYKASIYLSIQKPFEVFFREINENRLFMSNIINSLTYPFYVIDAKNYQIVMANKASGMDLKGGVKCYEMIYGNSDPCKKDQCPLEIVKQTKKSVLVE